ncbi:right-handed parallel beta-helix repeat-containing protein [Planctomycetota bacterium]
MKKYRYVLMIVCIVLGVLSSQAAEQMRFSGLVKEGNFFVSPGGNDSWSGTRPGPNADKTDGPFATLQAARDAARKLKPEQPRRIIVLASRYFLQEPLELNAKDSGLTIEAAPGAKVVLYGGRKVSGWKKDGENFYSISIPSVKDRKLDFRALVVNDRLCRRARLPQKGTFNHRNAFERRNEDGTRRRATDEERLMLEYDPKDIGKWLDVNNAEIRLYHMWDESLVGIASNDTNAHTLTFSNPPGSPAGAFNVTKYIVWNVREGMKEPGQWYLDRTEGKLVYWPLPGEQVGEIEAIIPTTESIIVIQGTEDKPASDITIRGISLSVTTTPLVAGSFGAMNFKGAVDLSFVEDCRLQELEISNVSGYGIATKGGNVSVEKCHVYNTGAGGIRCGGDKTNVTDNHVHDVGIMYPSGIGIWVIGRDALISHNEIHDTTYSGINCGSRYDKYRGAQEHLVDYNLIYRTMQELRDGGCIYVIDGDDVVIRSNFARDTADVFDDYGVCAYYLDERSKNCLVENNLSVNIIWPSHNHKATKNTIRNNFFINRMDGQSRLEFNMSSDFVFEQNVVYTTGPLIIRNFKELTTFANNVIFSEKGDVICHKLREYESVDTYPLKGTRDNILSSPLITSYEQGVVRLAPDSAAYKLGIKPIDVSAAGPR